MQVDPTKPTSKAPGTKCLKLKCDEPLSKFAFKFKLRRYALAEASEVMRAAGGAALAAVVAGGSSGGGGGVVEAWGGVPPPAPLGVLEARAVVGRCRWNR